MGLMKKLTSAIVAASLVFSLVGTAFADWSAAGVAAAANRMKALGVVKGTVLADGSVDMALSANITRAQLVTIVVRAFGQGDNAALLAGAPAFTDSASHWASGEIAIAKNLIEKNGFTLGITPTTFVPNKDVSAAEAIAFVMKFLGIKAAAGQTWPMDYIQGALDAGIISADDKAALAAFPNSAANRGLVFYLADKAFAGYKMADGKTLYTKYVDTTAPVVTVDSFKAVTEDANVTLTGKVSGASALTVAGAAVTPAIDGTWTATVALKLGANPIDVKATDIAGNVGMPASAVAITRNPGAAATIKASLAADTLAAGATSVLTVAVSDKAGNALADATSTVTADAAIGTFDSATMTLTAATKPATGNLTITSGDATTTVAVTVTAGALAKVEADKAVVNKGDIVTLTAKDEFGNVITSGVTYSQTSADAMVDATSGKFLASKAGSYTVTAKAGDKTATIIIGIYGSAEKLVISAPENALANGETQFAVTVKAVDANGNVVTNNESSFKLAGSGLTIADKDGKNGAADEKTVATTSGMYTFKVTAPVGFVGQIIELTATDVTPGRAAADTLTDADKVTVEATGQVSTSVKVKANTYVTANAQADTADAITIQVLDQAGEKMATGSFEAVVTVTGPITIKNSDDKFVTNATYTVAAGEAKITIRNQQGVTGAVSIAAVVDGVGSASGKMTAAFAGTASQMKATYAKASDTSTAVTGPVAAGTAVRVKVEVQDANGVPVGYTGDISITPVKEDTDVKLYADATADPKVAVTAVTFAGESSKTFDVVAEGGFTGTYELKLDNVVATPDLTAVTAAVAMNPGDYTKVQMATRGQETIKVPVGITTANITAQLYDDLGNKVAASGVKLTFKGFAVALADADPATDATSDAITLNGTAKTVDVTTDATGAATVAVSVRPYTAAGALGVYYVAVSGKTADDADLVANENEGGDSLALAGVEAAAQAATSISISYLRPAFGATNASPISSLYLKNSGVDYENKLVVKAVVKDNYGQALNGEKANLKIVAADAVLWTTKLVNASDYGTVTWYEKGETPAALAGITIGNGEYYAVVNVGKAGTISLGVKDVAGATDVVATKPLLVYAAAASKVVVTEANSDNEISIASSTVAGPFTLQLTDDYKNYVSSATKKTITVTGTGIAVRKSAGDVSVESLGLYNNVKFYVTTTSSVDVPVTFDDGAGVTGEVTFTIQ